MKINLQRNILRKDVFKQPSVSSLASCNLNIFYVSVSKNQLPLLELNNFSIYIYDLSTCVCFLKRKESNCFFINCSYKNSFYIDVLHSGWLFLMSCLNWFYLLILVEGPLGILIGCMTFLLLFLDVIMGSVSTVSFLVLLLLISFFFGCF